MIGGRSGWLAWPAGIVCVGVVAGLVALAAPAVPAALRFVGDALRTGTTAGPLRPADAPKPLAEIGTALTDDCSSLYPPDLWVELTWAPHTVLSQNQAPLPTSATSVVDAVRPAVRMTCAWRDVSGGTVTTTLADLDASAQPIVAAGLPAKGFSCTASGSGILCTRTSGQVVETEVVRGGVWLSTAERGWHPPGYTDRLVARLWP